MKKLLPIVLALAGFAPVAVAGTTTMLSPLYGFGPGSDGSIQPPASYPPYPPMTIGSGTAGYQRGYACDPVTGNAILADPNVGSAGTNPNFQGGVYVIDGLTGNVLSTLDTNGIYGGIYPASALGVADDGAVYMCNAVNTSGTAPFIIYRWASVWQSNVPPSIAFSNTITPSQRYGVTMAVRGSGTGTQIITGSKIGGTGTNVTIFTTANGINFTAIPMATDVTTADFTDGIAFGSGNTFWAKTVSSHPLRLMSFNLGTSNATTLASFDTNSIPGTANLGPLAIDLNRKLLAGLEVVSISAGPQKVWLYDITANLADPTRAPVLLDIKPFTPQNAFGTAPNGYLSFGAGGKLYAHAINNGLLGLTADTVPTPAPTFLNQPAASQRVVTGRSASFQALAYPAAAYQWRKNGANIPNATNATYTIATTTLGDTSTYTVVVSNNSGSVLVSSDSVLRVVNPADLYHLTSLWSVSPSAGTAYMNSTGGSGTPNQRTIAYNAAANELYIVSKAGSTYSIYAINATNVSATPPAVLKQLNTTGISGGAITLVGIAVSDDGSIYACNEDIYSTGIANWKLYRWANSDPATAPQCVYQGEPANQSSRFRWGDVLAVRGGGTSTQIMIDDYDTAARYISVLTPTSSSLTSFTPCMNFLTQTYGTSIGRSLEFGAGNTIWQKRQSTQLVQSSFDPLNPGSITTTLGTYSGFPVGVGAVSLSLDRNLCAGVNTNAATGQPHTLDLYDVADLNSPLLIAQYTFPVARTANNNAISQTLIAGNYLFTIEGNNGLMAFKIMSGPPAAPTFTQQPQNLRVVEGGSGTLTVVPDQVVNSYQWTRNGTNLATATALSYTINNALLTDAASYRCIVSNAYGMATSTVAVVTITATNDICRLSPIWSASPTNGPAYVTSTGGANTPQERYIAFNSLSNQLLVVQRDTIDLPTTYTVWVVNGSTGTTLYKLRTDVTIFNNVVSEVNGSTGLGLDAIAVADDGAVYACNLSPNASGGTTNGYDPAKLFRVYRWANTASNTAPTQIFSGDPANQNTVNVRWGDTFNVRGSGLNTEIILDSRLGDFGAILKPTDSSMAAFTNFWWNSHVGSGELGRSLEFAGPTACWQKRKGIGVKYSAYDTNANASVVLADYYNFPSTLGGVTMDLARKIAVGVDFVGTAASTPDAVGLYDITDINAPWLISRYNFPAAKTSNANFFGNTLIAGNRVFSLDANNGIVAFNILTPKSPVTISHIVSNPNDTVTINYAGGGGSAFVLVKSSAINVAKDAWLPVLTNSTSPGTFTVPMTDPGKLFYSIQSK